MLALEPNTHTRTHTQRLSLAHVKNARAHPHTAAHGVLQNAAHALSVVLMLSSDGVREKPRRRFNLIN